jgi:hypothetical protein
MKGTLGITKEKLSRCHEKTTVGVLTKTVVSKKQLSQYHKEPMDKNHVGKRARLHIGA